MIDGGSFKNNNNTFTGDDVLFVLKNNASIDFGGNSTSQFSGLTNATASSLGYSGDALDQLTDMLMMEDAATQSGVTRKWRGSSSSLLDGQICCPNGTAHIGGNLRQAVLAVPSWTYLGLRFPSQSTVTRTVQIQ